MYHNADWSDIVLNFENSGRPTSVYGSLFYSLYNVHQEFFRVAIIFIAIVSDQRNCNLALGDRKQLLARAQVVIMERVNWRKESFNLFYSE